MHGTPKVLNRHHEKLFRFAQAGIQMGSNRQGFMEGTEIIGLIAGTCTSAALVPQVLTTIKKNRAGCISLDVHDSAGGKCPLGILWFREIRITHHRHEPICLGLGHCPDHTEN